MSSFLRPEGRVGEAERLNCLVPRIAANI